jgi:hypothetical protein
MSLFPILSAKPVNANIGYSNSFIKLKNDLDVPLYAQLIYSVGTGIGVGDTPTPATITQGNKTVAAAATPERIVASSTLVTSVEIVARKGRGVANTGDVWIGPQSANDAQLRRLTPGDAITLTAPAGKKIDLNLIFVDVATDGDGIIFTAID